MSDVFLDWDRASSDHRTQARQIGTIGRAAVNRFFTIFEHLFCWGVVCVYCYAFLPAIRFSHDDIDTVLGDSDPTNQLLQIGILLVMTVLALRYWKRGLVLLRRAWGAAAVTAFCFLSIVWSDAPGLTARRALVFSVTGAFALYVAVRFELPRFARIVSWSAAFMGTVSVALMVAFPAIGLEQVGQNAGLPRGVFTTKNVFGYTMLVCSIFALYAALGEGTRQRRGFRAPYWLIWLLCLALAVAARSGTVFLAIAAAYGCWGAAAVIRRQLPMRLLVVYGFVVGLVLIAAAVVLFPDRAAGLLGKDDSLSGRDTLWAAVEDYIAVKPMLGYGYAAFWRDAGPEATRIWELIRWNAPHAHNAVLELLLEIGVVGTAVAAAFYTHVYGRVCAAAWRGERWAGPLAAVLAAMFVQSLTEANALHQGDISWVLLLLADFTCAASAIARTNGSGDSWGIGSAGIRPPPAPDVSYDRRCRPE